MRFYDYLAIICDVEHVKADIFLYKKESAYEIKSYISRVLIVIIFSWQDASFVLWI